ncbi:MAG: VWA domain-containing protein [Terracidiphilus sp.]
MPRGKSLGEVLLCLTLTWAALLVPRNASSQTAPPESSPSPQLIPRTHAEREMRYKMEHRIILNVQVNDASGRHVTGLHDKDFTLLQDLALHPLVSVREVPLDATITPAHVILLLDTVNSSSRDLGDYRRSIQHFLEQSPSLLPYPVSIAVVTGVGPTLSKSSTSRDTVLADLKTLTPSLHPYDCTPKFNPSDAFLATAKPGQMSIDNSAQQLSCLNDRFTRSINALDQIATQQANIPGRAILIWISSGWPLLYEKQFRADDDATRQNFFEHLVHVSTALREGQVTLDLVLPSNLLTRSLELNDHDRSFLNGLPAAADATAGSLSLQALAHQSGGQLLVHSKDLEAEITQGVADATGYYVLIFDSAAAANFGEFHTLTITVNRPGVTVRTNTMFYAEQ